jgi:hypothetical protein
MPTGSKFLAEELRLHVSRENASTCGFFECEKLSLNRELFSSRRLLSMSFGSFGQRFVFTRPMFGRNLAPNPLALRKKCEFANMSRSSLLSSLPACTPVITHGWQSTLALSLSRSLFLSLSLAGDDRQNPYPSTMCCLGRNPQIFATNRRGPGAPPVRPRSSIPCSILARAR